jgi:hypothetical protein
MPPKNIVSGKLLALSNKINELKGGSGSLRNVYRIAPFYMKKYMKVLG